jgi:hypothetical protein
MELHGNPARYLQQMDAQQALFDQRYQMRKDEVRSCPPPPISLTLNRRRHSPHSSPPP